MQINHDTIQAQAIIDAWPEATAKPLVLPMSVNPNQGEDPDPAADFVRAVAHAHEAGMDISFAGLFAGEIRRRISIPGYPFRQRRHWIEPRPTPVTDAETI